MTYFPEDASLEQGEAILTPNAKALLGVDAGDRVTLDTPAGSYDLLVTGFRSGSSRYATDSGTGETTALLVKGEQVGAFLRIDTFREILAANQDAGSPAYYVQFSETANARRTLSEIKAQLPEAKVNEHMILLAAMGAGENRMAKNVYPLVVVVCLLVLLAGVLMISGSLNSAIAQRTQFFGMMRCIGMSRRQVIRFVELEALNWCKTAVPAGIILGTLTTWLLVAFMHRFVGGEFARMAVFGVSPVGMVSGAVVGVLTVLLAARAPAKKAAKVSPVAAVSGGADAGGQRHRRANTSLMNIETALGVSHAAASKKSLLLMAGSFALRIILFLCFSVLVDLLGIMFPTKSYSADIDINLSESGELIHPDLIAELQNMPGVINAFGRRYAPAVPAEFSVAVDRDNVDLLSYDDLQLDWIPGDGDLRKGGDLGKVYGDHQRAVGRRVTGGRGYAENRVFPAGGAVWEDRLGSGEITMTLTPEGSIIDHTGRGFRRGFCKTPKPLRLRGFQLGSGLAKRVCMAGGGLGMEKTGRAIAASGWSRLCFFLVQFTWGLPVNLAGLAVFLCCRGLRVERFHNSVVTYLPGDRGGLSLGVFIFLSVRSGGESLRVHEYGHTVQCLFLGPLYWLVVALPSAVWYHFFDGCRRARRLPYDALYCERWATAWGRRWSGE